MPQYMRDCVGVTTLYCGEIGEFELIRVGRGMAITMGLLSIVSLIMIDINNINFDNKS